MDAYDVTDRQVFHQDDIAATRQMNNRDQVAYSLVNWNDPDWVPCAL